MVSSILHILPMGYQKCTSRSTDCQSIGHLTPPNSSSLFNLASLSLSVAVATNFSWPNCKRKLEKMIRGINLKAIHM
jgi:hypothetical protein